MHRQSTSIAFPLMLLLIGTCVGEPNFKIENASSVTAVFSSESLDLDLGLGDLTKYPDPEHPLKFHLIVGGCDTTILGSKLKPSGVNFQINGGKTFANPSGFRVTKDKLDIIADGGPNSVSCSSSIALKKLDDGNFTVSVELKGDVPPGLSLTSKTAKLYDPKLHGGKSGLPTWAIIVICVVGALVILVIGASVLLFIRRRRQKQKKLEPVVEVESGTKVAKKPKEAVAKPKPEKSEKSTKPMSDKKAKVVSSIKKMVAKVSEKMPKLPKKKKATQVSSEDSVEPATVTTQPTEGPTSLHPVSTQKTSDLPSSHPPASTQKSSLNMKETEELKTAIEMPTINVKTPKPPSVKAALNKMKAEFNDKIVRKGGEIEKLKKDIELEQKGKEFSVDDRVRFKQENKEAEVANKKTEKKVADLSGKAERLNMKAKELKDTGKKKDDQIADYSLEIKALESKMANCSCDKPSNPCFNCKKDQQTWVILRTMSTQSSSSNSGTRPTTTCSTETKTTSKEGNFPPKKP